MPWPFGSSSDRPAPQKHDTGASSPASSRPGETNKGTVTDVQAAVTSWLKSAGIDPDWDHYKEAKNWLPTVLITVTAVSSLSLYRTYLRRIPTAAHIPPNAFRRRSLFGRVTSVGDGDGFHFYHTPGGRWAGWGWLRRVPTSKAELKGQTIPIRLAGVDAPEGAHFGRPGQPFAAEALHWLSAYVLGWRVRAYIHRRDQYERVVATVKTRRWFLLRTDVGLEMLKRGLATTYEAKTGSEFGGREAKYKAAEAKAKSRKKGMWGLKGGALETPREYKKRMGMGDGDMNP